MLLGDKQTRQLSFESLTNLQQSPLVMCGHSKFFTNPPFNPFFIVGDGNTLGAWWLGTCLWTWKADWSHSQRFPLSRLRFWFEKLSAVFEEKPSHFCSSTLCPSRNRAVPSVGEWQSCDGELWVEEQKGPSQPNHLWWWRLLSFLLALPQRGSRGGFFSKILLPETVISVSKPGDD